MKIRFLLLPALLSLSVCATADEKKDGHKHDHPHDHDEKMVGPNGGRVVTATEPHFEFLVLEDRKIQITFLSDEGEAVAPGEATVSAVGGKRSQPTRFAFSAAEKSLVSDLALPEGDRVPLVLQVKLTPAAKTVTEKFTVDLAQCPTCEYPEYACICDHDHDHDHKDEKKAKK